LQFIIRELGRLQYGYQLLAFSFGDPAIPHHLSDSLYVCHS
jgi:hypothetical protein